MDQIGQFFSVTGACRGMGVEHDVAEGRPILAFSKSKRSDVIGKRPAMNFKDERIFFGGIEMGGWTIRPGILRLSFDIRTELLHCRKCPWPQANLVRILERLTQDSGLDCPAAQFSIPPKNIRSFLKFMAGLCRLRATGFDFRKGSLGRPRLRRALHQSPRQHQLRRRICQSDPSAYPGDDFTILNSGVGTSGRRKGYIDTNNLFVNRPVCGGRRPHRLDHRTPHPISRCRRALSGHKLVTLCAHQRHSLHSKYWFSRQSLGQHRAIHEKRSLTDQVGQN